MSKKALEDEDYELIKAHVLDPDNSPLPVYKQEILDRIISASKVLDKNPIQKNAIAIHHAKYGHISRVQAWRDIRQATKLFNSYHTFDWNLWQNWLLDSITTSIKQCRTNNDPASLKVMSAEHANLIKLIGKKPEELADPLRNEKHEFYIVMQPSGPSVRLNINKIKELPVATIEEITKSKWGGQEITDITAEEIMNS